MSGVTSPTHTSLGGNKYSLEDAKSILTEIKSSIVSILSQGVTSISSHRSFIQSIHGRLRSGRERSSSPVNYFILNYDTLFEDVLALERIVFTDGFIGGVSAWWDPSCYESSGSSTYNLQARVIKLHGSIDWIPTHTSPFPIRLRPSLHSIVDGELPEPAVIYPASVKYREAQNDPYAHLIQIFRNTLASGSDHVLCVIGYSFGDEHINTEVLHALQQNNALSLIAFLGGDDIPPAIVDWLGDSELCEQIQVFGHKIVVKGSKTILEAKNLPEIGDGFDWYKFEELVSILAGDRE